jgi:capsular exopolysaccharide synthesis family protein
VVGEIPRNKAQTSEHASLHVINTPNSLSTEAFRRLRASVLFLLADKPHKRIAVTSTISQEGKSYVSTNFAGILSMMDKKVVIIDTDLRKPRLHFAFGLNNDVGVSTYLIGRNDIDDIIQHTESANLDVVTTGLKPPNPAELLATPRFEQLLLELEERYDYVVIDTSPIGMVTDAIAVLNKVPVCLYMFRAKYSKKHFLNNVEYLMKKNELNNIYMVFNATEYRGVFGKQYSSSFVYGDGYGYGYGYGYVYGGGGPKSNRKGFGYFEEVEETKRPWWQFWKKNQQAD